MAAEAELNANPGYETEQAEVIKTSKAISMESREHALEKATQLAVLRCQGYAERIGFITADEGPGYTADVWYRCTTDEVIAAELD
jgi:hypothetical protein